MSQTITKREKFDEDVMKPLLTDPRFNKADLKRLSQYNKHRVSGSEINVSYKFGGGCDEYELGRLFPEDGIGLQSFRFDIRNPLSQKYYWDTDVENAHFRIALTFCANYGIIHNKLKYYVEHRDECLALVSNKRKKAKTEFLKVLYGGDIKLYCSLYDNECDGTVTREGFVFLKELEAEVGNLMLMIWTKNPHLHELKIGQEKKKISKKPNPHASLMSLIFQTEERKILLVWDRFLQEKGRYLAVYIHDGGLVEKMEGETKFPEELLAEGAVRIKEELNYELVLTQKEIKHEWKPYKPQETQYEIKKREFEERNFIVGSTFCCVHVDSYIEFMKKPDAKTKFENWKITVYDEEKEKNVTKPFLDMWLADEKRLQYERIDFIPNFEDCPVEIYNLFKGFKAEKYRPEQAMTDDEIKLKIEPIITHLDYLTTGNSAYLLQWMANIIQTPHIKSEVAPLIRDEGGLIVEGGGTGKNLLFEWFGNEIMGEDYLHVVGDNKELYTPFNSLFEGKLLVFVEEASGQDNHANADALKAKITSKTINVNKKMVAQYKTRDYTRYVFTSNNRNPMPIKQGNRRFAVFDTNPVKRGDTEYFKELVRHLNDNNVKWAFYQYLKNLKDTFKTPIDFQKNIPITKAYKDIRILNAPLYHKWLVSCLKKGELKDDSTSNLYKSFIKWVERNREGKVESAITQTAFGLMLTNSKECGDYNISKNIGNKEHTRDGNIMKWNVEGLIQGLKEIHLLDENFEYEPTLQTGVCHTDTETLEETVEEG